MPENSIEEILKNDGVYVSTTSGVSMYPMLRDRRDTIVVTPTQARLKKYDVALYRRGDSYVLHRVIKVLPDSYVIRGDNCALKEYVPNSSVLGKLTEVWRADKKLNMQCASYKAYSRLVTFFNPIVRIKLRISGILHRGGR